MHLNRYNLVSLICQKFYESYPKPFFIGVLLFNLETYDFQVFRLADFIVRRALALCTLTFFKIAPVGYLQNFDNACFRCLTAFLQSLLYHGLLFFGFVEVFGIHLSDIFIREEVKSVTRSEELLKLSMLKSCSHNK